MIYARKNKQENGDYTDGNAERWSVIFARNPFTPARWQRFGSEEAALAAWGLTYDPPSPLQGYGVASPSTPRQDGVASPSTPRQDAVASLLPVPEAEG